MKDKKELKEELELYKERLESAMDSGNLAWWEMELPSGKVKFNDRKPKMLGYNPEDFTHYSDFTELIHPEDHDQAMKAMENHLEGRKSRYETEYRIKKKNGDYKWFRDLGRITEQDGEYKKITGVVIDIDERKEAEEREDFLHTLLRHDVRNKIQIVLGYNDLIEEMDLPEEAQKYISKGRKGVEEALEIIEKVSHLREAQEEEIGEIKIEEAVYEGIDQAKPMAEEKDIDIKSEFPKDEVKVLAGELLGRVFSNIIENSIQHSQGNKILIHCKDSDDNVICVMEDNGVGISQDKMNEVFDRGYTMDEERGTGLGLFLVKTLVDIYEGNIKVKDSELGGARFEIHLKKP